MSNPLFQVQTILVEDAANVSSVGNDGSDSKQTVATIHSTALTFGNLAPGEQSSSKIIYLKIPNAISIQNIKIALIDTGGITFANNIFGVEIHSHIDRNIVPDQYFQGVNSDEIYGSAYNVDVSNATVNSSIYVYLSLNLPEDQYLGTGTVRYKWFFDYADEEVISKDTEIEIVNPDPDEWEQDIDDWVDDITDDPVVTTSTTQPPVVTTSTTQAPIPTTTQAPEPVPSHVFYDVFVMSKEKYDSEWNDNSTPETTGEVYRLTFKSENASALKAYQDGTTMQSIAFNHQKEWMYRPINETPESSMEDWMTGGIIFDDGTTRTELNGPQSYIRLVHNLSYQKNLPWYPLNANLYLRAGSVGGWAFIANVRSGYIARVFEGWGIGGTGRPGEQTKVYLTRGPQSGVVTNSYRAGSTTVSAWDNLASTYTLGNVKTTGTVNPIDTDIYNQLLDQQRWQIPQGSQWAFLYGKPLPSELVVREIKQGEFYPSWYNKYVTTDSYRYQIASF